MWLFISTQFALYLFVETLTIGAFNIRIFGVAKSRKLDVMENIRRVIQNYDIVLVQEIRDRTQVSLDRLYRLLNGDSSVRFSYIKSERLGRSNSKEQYAFYYRSDKIDVIASHQYIDYEDVFERPPFSVLLRIPLADCQEHLSLALVGLHTKTTRTVEEIAHLGEVVTQVKSKLLTRNVLVMGDLNAGCGYADAEDLATAEVFSNTRKYVSLIGDDVDTTVYSSTFCAYDRMIVSGNELLSLDPSADVDRFDVSLGLSYSQALAVSDHYPVKMILTLPQEK